MFPVRSTVIHEGVLRPLTNTSSEAPSAEYRRMLPLPGSATRSCPAAPAAEIGTTTGVSPATNARSAASRARQKIGIAHLQMEQTEGRTESTCTADARQPRSG